MRPLWQIFRAAGFIQDKGGKHNRSGVKRWKNLEEALALSPVSRENRLGNYSKGVCYLITLGDTRYPLSDTAV